MNEKNLPRMQSSEKRSASAETQPVHPNPSRVRRRSFLKRLGMAGATLLPAGALLATKGKALLRLICGSNITNLEESVRPVR